MKYDGLVVTLDAPNIRDAQMYALLALHVSIAIRETVQRFNVPPSTVELKATFHKWEDGPPRVMMVFRVTLRAFKRADASGRYQYLLTHACDDEGWLWVDQHQTPDPADMPTLDDFENMGPYPGLEAYYEIRATVD